MKNNSQVYQASVPNLQQPIQTTQTIQSSLPLQSQAATTTTTETMASGLSASPFTFFTQCVQHDHWTCFYYLDRLCDPIKVITVDSASKQNEFVYAPPPAQANHPVHYCRLVRPSKPKSAATVRVLMKQSYPIAPDAVFIDTLGKSAINSVIMGRTTSSTTNAHKSHKTNKRRMPRKKTSVTTKKKTAASVAATTTKTTTRLPIVKTESLQQQVFEDYTDDVEFIPQNTEVLIISDEENTAEELIRTLLGR